MMSDTVRFEGACFAIEIVPRAESEPLFEVYVEDDGNWFPWMGHHGDTPVTASVHWAKELSQLFASVHDWAQEHGHLPIKMKG